MSRGLILGLAMAAAFSATPAQGQTGSVHEPVRFVGGTSIDLLPHDGRLRYAIGVANYQAFRANRTHPELADDSGWTYNHASSICYWNDTYYVQYLSNPVDEHIAPGQTLITHSKDGRNWSKAEAVFPPYEAPEGTPIPEGYDGYMMHQRVGFYVAPNGRLLTQAFYGHTESPFREGGIGRVVREVYKDGTYGPIYFIKYSSHADWNESNTSYPLYSRSGDKGFVEACETLMADPLATRQWWDEDRNSIAGEPLPAAGRRGAQAFCWYTRPDGVITGLWKWSLAALSEDGGKTFSAPVFSPTLTMDGAKMWGQRTPDGRYAIVYNPTVHSEHRYPLAVVTGDDGIIFDNMLLINGETPPRRFFGRWKDFGQQYVRGITEGNGTPPDPAMWITYSMNKEDMWVSRVPTPIRYAVDGPVSDDFENMEVGGHVTDWNVYSPRWSPVQVAAFPSPQNKSLELRDEEPHDYARAVRVFQEGTKATVTFKVHAAQTETGMLNIELMDQFGNRPVRMAMDEDGKMRAMNGHDPVELQAYAPNKWYDIAIEIDATPHGSYSVSIDGKEVLKDAKLSEAVKSVERISFRTGPHRDQPTRQTVNETAHPPLEGADDKIPAAIFHVDDLKAEAS